MAPDPAWAGAGLPFIRPAGVESRREAVLASIHLALLPGGKSDDALKIFRANESRLSYNEKMRALYVLWKGRGDATHLEKAHQLLLELRSHSPAEYRETMMANVPLHREICASWSGGGPQGGTAHGASQVIWNGRRSLVLVTLTDQITDR